MKEEFLLSIMFRTRKGVKSIPPVGGKKIVNLYIQEGELTLESDGEAVQLNLDDLSLVSNPPEGDNYKAVTNLYVEIIDGKPKLRIEYDE